MKSAAALPRTRARAAVRRRRAFSPASTPRTLLAQGYEIVQSAIEGGGATLLLRKGSDLVLVRLAEFRAGTDPVNGQLVVSFLAKVP